MRFIRTAAAIMAAAALSVSCSGSEQAAREPVESTATTPAADTPPPGPDRDGDGTPDALDEYPNDPLNTPVVEVTLACYLDDTFTTGQGFKIRGEPDFSTAWLYEPYECDATRNSVPLSAIEQQAFDASGYDDPASITTLYELCAEVEPTAAYTSGEHSASSSEQIAEITGVLTLCPDHPLAADLRATIERGQAEADLEASGQLFGSGTYLVGEEIEPGTYFVEGEIEGCYWERQDSAGEIIDNNFVGAGRRVEVTIRSSDYAFHSDGCGQWRPVG